MHTKRNTAITNDQDGKSTTKSYMANYADKIGRKTKPFSDKEYTPEGCVVDLLKLIPFDKNDFVLDAGSGLNKVWYNNIHTLLKDEVELEEGKDF